METLPETPPEATPAAPVLEIIRLHGEIVTSARMSLDKAIRIGQLLSEQKANLDHGQWLPWLKSNIPFAERTARNYMRCHAGRDRLKSASVADLSEAYRLLAPPPEPVTVQTEQEYQAKCSDDSPACSLTDGQWITGHASDQFSLWNVVIMPSVHDDFFFVNVFHSERAFPEGAGSLDGSMKPIRKDWLARTVAKIIGNAAGTIEWSAPWSDERWTYNQIMFSSEQDYVDQVILGKRRVAA